MVVGEKGRMLIVDVSGVYAEEGFPEALRAAGYPFEELDMTGLEGTECYCDPEAEAVLREAIATRQERLRWIDGGDYHYLSKLFAEREKEPFTLVLLDHHPDDQAPALGEILSCGGWVRDLMRDSKALERVIAVGPEGSLQTVEELRAALRETSPRRVYVSLDKDVMGPGDARTNWSQGTLTLAEVREMLRTVLESGAEIVGVDICGELSGAKGGHAEDFALNLKTNMALQAFVTEYLK